MARLTLRTAAAIAAGLLVATGAVMAAWEPITRKTYITVVDNQGQAVPGLTAADFTLKEGGKDREIASLEPARAKMRIALAIEEGLTPTGGARQGLGDFITKMAPTAEMSLVVVGLANRLVVPYTSDPNVLFKAINDLPLNQPRQTSHVAEGVGDLARAFVKERHERPVIVMIALDSQASSSEQPQNILNILKDSNAQLHVVSVEAGGLGGSAAQMMEASATGQILGDGPKQSGGRQWPITALTAIPKAMLSIANDLSNQYLLTYTLPDGVKPSDRLQVATKKRGVTLRSSTRISDK